RARITAAVVRRALVDVLALARLSHRVARQARGAGVAAVRVHANRALAAAAVAGRALVDVFLAVLPRESVGARAHVPRSRHRARPAILTGLVRTSVAFPAVPRHPQLSGGPSAARGATAADDPAAARGPGAALVTRRTRGGPRPSSLSASCRRSPRPYGSSVVPRLAARAPAHPPRPHRHVVHRGRIVAARGNQRQSTNEHHAHIQSPHRGGLSSLH